MIETHAHGLFHVNAGLHALRRAISARVPEDFNVTFVDNVDEVEIAYVWTGADRLEYQETVMASTFTELLVKWQHINWNERCAHEIASP